MGSAAFVGGISGVAFSGTVAADISLSEITSDPRVEAIESEIGSLSYGDVYTEYTDVNEYHDLNDDVDLEVAEVSTDNGTMRYSKNYLNGSMHHTEAVLTNFSHWNYDRGDIGLFNNSIGGYPDGTTHFRRTNTNSEIDDAKSSLGHDNVSGHTSDDVSGNVYPAWDDDDSDITVYDGDDVDGGGGGDDDDDKQTLKHVGDGLGATVGSLPGSYTPSGNYNAARGYNAASSYDALGGCSPDDPVTMWTNIGAAIASVGLTVASIWMPASWGLALHWGLTYGNVILTIVDCEILE